jgi:hypothetical protein
MQENKPFIAYANYLNGKQYTLQKVNDGYEIAQIIKENEAFDVAFKITFGKEIKHFLQFTAQMLLAFPLGLLMRYRIRKNKRLNHILQFEELKKVRNNIEKGSFAYDTILFKQNAFQIIKNKSHLANLVCLALLFGDEFIDGIATTYGKQNTSKVLKNNAYNYYLQHKTAGKKFELFYEFDICNVLPESVLTQTNAKYGITYKAFYQHLQFLLAEMNVHLNELPIAIANEAAKLICSVCNKCFDTYKVDVEAFTPNYDLTNLLQYQQSKDDEIIKILLELRATLLQKNKPSYKKKFASWAYMVRSMQVYDDMQDVAADCDYQMNFMAFFAKSFFINEWEWLQQNKEALKKEETLKVQQAVALNMPASMMLCMQYNKNITTCNLNWVQQKIQNYLWRKNWMNTKGKSDAINITIQSIAASILLVQNELISTEMKYAQILDTALLFPNIKEKIFILLNKKERYYLNNFYTTLPTSVKSNYAKKIIHKP